MLSCPASVRIAVAADSEELFAFVWEAHEETRHAARSEAKIRYTIGIATEHRRNPVMAIIRTPRGIEAAIGLQFSQWWWSDDSVLMSFFYYVHPDHRRTTHAADLRTFAEWFAEQINMKCVLVDWSGTETGKTRLFARHGKLVGSMFEQGVAA